MNAIRKSCKSGETPEYARTMRRCPILVTLGACALVAAASAGATTPLPGIRSPTGNISCFLVASGPDLLLCSIAHSSYAGALQAKCMRPDGSGVDWHGFELRPTKSGGLNCTGGILYDNGKYRPQYAMLPYGTSWHRAAFTCTSRRTGVTCQNPGGHGFFISRGSYRTW
jgi:hypothetical protein